MMYLCKLFLFFISTFTLFHSTILGQELMHVCSMFQNSSCNNPFKTSLNDLLNFLKNEAPYSGFAVASTGEGGNRIHGLAQCRVDLSPTDCAKCVTNAISDILKDCPNHKGAMVLHEGCTIEYSNEDNFIHTMQNSMLCLTSQDNVSDPYPKFFSQKTHEFLSQISQEAVMDPNLYGTGRSEIDEYNTVYGYAQCNRDLSSMDCNQCLNQSLVYLQTCGEEKEGVRVYNGICRLRYEIYPFLHDEYSCTPSTCSPSPDANSPYPQPEDGSAHGFEPEILIVIALLSIFLTQYAIEYV